MSEHTPLPWRQDPFVDAIHILAADGSKVANLADRPLDSIGMPPDNAAFIVLAVNAHDDLVKALEEARQMLANLQDNHLYSAAAVVRALVQKRIEAADAALTKATSHE